MEAEKKQNPCLGQKYSTAVFAPTRGEVKYLALKMVSVIRNKRFETVAEAYKRRFLSTLEHIGHTLDPTSPPCTNCPAITVYFCGKYALECRDFLRYSNGGRAYDPNKRRKRVPKVNTTFDSTEEL